MKKLQLVELGVISAALILGYKMITSLLTLITTLLFGFGTGLNRNLMMAILPTVFFFAFYMITFFFLAKNVNPLARFMTRGNNDPLDLKLNKVAVLHVIIIAICLVSFLQTIPDVVEYEIKKIIPRPGDNDEYFGNSQIIRERVTFMNSLISLIISTILLVTSKNIASFFGKEDPSYEIGGEKIESNI